jgi:hypothetical protein
MWKWELLPFKVSSFQIKHSHVRYTWSFKEVRYLWWRHQGVLCPQTKAYLASKNLRRFKHKNTFILITTHRIKASSKQKFENKAFLMFPWLFESKFREIGAYLFPAAILRHRYMRVTSLFTAFWGLGKATRDLSKRFDCEGQLWHLRCE